MYLKNLDLELVPAIKKIRDESVTERKNSPKNKGSKYAKLTSALKLVPINRQKSHSNNNQNAHGALPHCELYVSHCGQLEAPDHTLLQCPINKIRMLGYAMYEELHKTGLTLPNIALANLKAIINILFKIQ